MRIGLLPAAFAVVLAAPVYAADFAGPARAIDGGTVEFGGAPIRLYGIDAPAQGQACARNDRPYDCAQEASWALAERPAATGCAAWSARRIPAAAPARPAPWAATSM
jgi:endonuclease YncB( thermonuclease family)